MKKTLFSVFVLLTVLLLTSCSGTAKINTEVTDSELGLKAWVEEGSYLYIEAKGNPTTGYEWKALLDNEDVVECVVTEYQVDKSEYEMVGVGGVYTFVYQAKSAGSTRIVLSYARSWEVSAAKTAVFDVTVDANNNVSFTMTGESK
jgi:inhibitor of cysteine peptidase